MWLTFKQERNGNQDHIAINDNVSNDADPVLNIVVDDKHIVSIILYERMKPKASGEPCFPMANAQAMSGASAINGWEGKELQPPELKQWSGLNWVEEIIIETDYSIEFFYWMRFGEDILYLNW